MNYFFKKNGGASRFPFQRRWYYSPAQILLHRLYPDLPEYKYPDHYEDVVSSDWIPLVDIIDNPDSIMIKVELPGVEKTDLSLTIKNKDLWIQGERKRNLDGVSKYYCCEGNYGTFVRRIELPESADKQKVVSELKNGILTIVIQKKKENLDKKIEIK